MHPSQETLSAYLDGELTPKESLQVGRHTRDCPACANTLAAFSSLDSALLVPPAVSHEAALALASARHDGELDSSLDAVAQAHLGTCPSCQMAAAGWDRLDQALATLPVQNPSARVDAALERYRRPPVRTGRIPRSPVPAWSLRAVAAVAVAIAVLLSLPQQVGPELAADAASLQQSVLDTHTDTLYVLHPQEALVAALNATTFVSRASIPVGGKPIALALNPAADQVLVLDAEAKTLTAIDSHTNSVVAATTVDVPGTPTSIQVDGSGKVVVASIITDTGAPGGPIPSAAPSIALVPTTTGAVSVIDPLSKKVETVSRVDVAPRQVVIDPSGKRALLVSSQGTTIVDPATYKPLDKAPGGIAATFSAVSGEFAILSASNGAALVTFSAHSAVLLSGTPRAITALPDGSYAVLTADPTGAGHITTLAADGSVETSVSAPAGRDITFDPLTGSVAVIGAAGVTNVPLASLALAPSALPSAVPSPAIVPSPSSPVILTPVAQPSPSPSASPSASPSGSPSASPSAIPEESAPVAALPSANPSLVPTGARLLSGTTYLYQPRIVHPVRVAGDGERVWSLDASNKLWSLHTTTGDVFQIASLPATAKIAALLPSPNYVYLTDPDHGVLYVVRIQTGQIVTSEIPFLPVVADAVTSPDDRLWLVTDGLGLVSYDPRAKRTDVADVGGTRFSAVGVDAIGRVLLAPRDRPVLDVYDPYATTLTELVFPHTGSITAILVDRQAAVWVGTDTGQIFAMRNSKLDTAASVGRAIDRLVLGPSGNVWYVSRTGGETTFGPADGSALALHAPLGVSTPAFDDLGRAWVQDPVSGGFFVTLPRVGR